MSKNKKFYIIFILFLLMFYLTFFSIIMANYSKIIIKVLQSEKIFSKKKSVSQKNNNTYIQNDFGEFVLEEYAKSGLNQAHNADILGFVNKYEEIKKLAQLQGYNFLLLGCDEINDHPEKKHYMSMNKARHADSIILMKLTFDGKIISMSLPRDTLFESLYGIDKLSHIYYKQGNGSIIRNIENLLKININGYVIINNFKAFKQLYNILGHLTIDKYLDADKALFWLRNRQFKFGDIERCKRQQVFMQKSIKQFWKLCRYGNPFFSNLIWQISCPFVQTNIKKEDYRLYMDILKKNKFQADKDYYSFILPGYFSEYKDKMLTKNLLSCWIIDQIELEYVKKIFKNF